MGKDQKAGAHQRIFWAKWPKPVVVGRVTTPVTDFRQPARQITIRLAGGLVWRKTGNGWQFFNEMGSPDERFAAYGPALHVRVDPYGNATILFKSHARIVMREDRSVLFFDSERRLKAVQFPDGTIRQQVYDGETLIAWKGPDGKLWQRCCVSTLEGRAYFDRWTVTSAKHTHSGSRSIWSGKVAVDPVSGTLTMTSIRNLNSETRTKWYSDGFKETIYKDGRRALSYLNGESIIYNPDGSTGAIAPLRSSRPIS